jgi:hypothetical protein
MRSNAALKAAPAQAVVSETPVAQIAIKAANGDREKAIDLLYDMLVKDEAYIRENMARIMRAHARELVSHEVGAMRKAAMKSAQPLVIPASRHSQAVKIAVAAEHQRLMDEMLYGSLKRLGDSTVEEVRESSRQYQSHANSAGIKARYHALVAAEAEKNGSGDSLTIRSILTEATLAKLWEQANA